MSTLDPAAGVLGDPLRSGATAWRSFHRDGILPPSRHKPGAAEVPFRAHALTAEHVDAIYELHRTAHALAVRPELVRLDTRDYFAEHIEGHGLILGVFVGDALVGYGLISIPTNDAENYGTFLGLPHDEFPLVGQLEGAAVHHDWWGRGLHNMLARWRVACLHNAGYRHICATVAPRNTWSLNNLLRVGMTVREIATLYGGLTRYVLQWEGPSYAALKPAAGDIPLSLDDLDAQRAVIAKGARGAILQGSAAGGWTLVFHPVLEPIA
ncbi:MAG: hypothetical protein VR70_00690 [Rhodospirillaceae bacterium BRH_c57]|nr:MAG: hypothetical protein VR70_00690 [Rhodospirillaceae bacterium BRH_c57]